MFSSVPIIPLFFFSYVDTMLPCEFCEDLFPEMDLILHQVRRIFWLLAYKSG